MTKRAGSLLPVFFQLSTFHFLHIVFVRMMIAAQTARTIPPDKYPNHAGRVSMNSTETRSSAVMTAIPAPVTRHSFFSSYFCFSFLPAVR